MGSSWSSMQSKYSDRIGDLLNTKTKFVADEFAPNPPEPSIAIIGGGIIGLLVALGLIHRGFRVAVYERASKFTETSAGITFSAGAREALRHIAPCALEAIEEVGAASEYPYIRYYDGFTPGLDDAQWQIPLDKLNYYGCLRAAFLEVLGREIPEGVMQFGKSLERYEEGKNGQVVLTFGDGSVVEADAVIGCDGIKSRTRQIMFGDDPSAHANFQHVVSYRALLPLDSVVAALGPDKGYTHCLHVGPDAYTVTYPVANNTLSNVILFCNVPGPWPSNRLQEVCRRETAQRALKDWKPDIRSVIDLLPEFPNKWAIFDMSEHPARTYTSGRICLAGDAAHASTPFLGSGAGQGVEDAAVLATTLDTALKQSGMDKGKAITAAFAAYNTVRLKRSQRVVRDSRAAGATGMWQDAENGRDPEKCHAEIWGSYSRILDNDADEMVEGARRECLRLLALTADK